MRYELIIFCHIDMKRCGVHMTVHWYALGAHTLEPSRVANITLFARIFYLHMAITACHYTINIGQRLTSII